MRNLYRNFLLIFLYCCIGSLLQAELNPNCTVMIPMRDGNELPTDIYLPPDVEVGKAPCVLLRCPAGRKAPPWRAYAALSQIGYVVAMQDTRSALDQEGKTVPYMSDGWGKHQDGFDTVEWLAKSTFTNGKIGTIGFSAVGITQLLMAPSAPPSLKCQYIGIAASSLFHHGIFQGGQIYKNQVEGWLSLYAKDSGVHSFVFGQPFYNDFWEGFDSLKVADRVQVPGVHYGGWYDTFLQGTIDGFIARQERGGPGAKGTQKLFIGPWTHHWPATKRLGDFDVPKEGEELPVDLSINTWLDHHLKGIDNGVNHLPAVTYYVMGPFDGSPSKGNRWKHADHWPVPFKETTFYLSESKELVPVLPSKKEFSFSYKYDPENPIMTVGGRNLFLESGPKDLREIEKREDIVVFTSKPFEEDVEITGRMKALIFFASNKKDTDLVVRLSDVYPDGRSILIADGIQRIGIDQNYTPGQIRELFVDLWSTSIVFAKGHSLRVSISSSNYPHFEKNLNVGLFGSHAGKSEIAENKVFTGTSYPSRIILPFIDEVLSHGQ